MKAVHYILLFVVLLSIGGLVWFLIWKNKQAKAANADKTNTEPKANNVQVSNPLVADLQRQLNLKLSENEKLVVDGIYGPKTKAAIEKVTKGNAPNDVFDLRQQIEFVKDATKKVTSPDISEKMKETIKFALQTNPFTALITVLF